MEVIAMAYFFWNKIGEKDVKMPGNEPTENGWPFIN